MASGFHSKYTGNCWNPFGFVIMCYDIVSLLFLHALIQSSEIN